MITRSLQGIIEEKLFKGKAIIVIGARQVGKSTLLREIVNTKNMASLFLDCDEPEVRELLTNTNTQRLKSLIGNNKIVVIDEAQKVAGIGQTLKLITDNIKEVQLLVSGSSSLMLQNTINEPLTGRKYEYFLYPLSTKELYDYKGFLYVNQILESRLIYGSYPDIVNNSWDSKDLITNLTGSYLYKDILTLDNIRKPALLDKLLVALALQVGNEVSYNELAQTVGTDNKTVEKYIDLLEKCFIIFKLSAYNKNIRTELKKSKKIYFYDNGIRNAVIQRFSPLNMREDSGALWENFIIGERIKANQYNKNYVRSYFWRTTQQQEIDYLEESEGQLLAFEFKWNPKKGKTSIPKIFTDTYSVKKISVITPANYLEWIGAAQAE